VPSHLWRLQQRVPQGRCGRQRRLRLEELWRPLLLRLRGLLQLRPERHFSGPRLQWRRGSAARVPGHLRCFPQRVPQRWAGRQWRLCLGEPQRHLVLRLRGVQLSARGHDPSRCAFVSTRDWSSPWSKETARCTTRRGGDCRPLLLAVWASILRGEQAYTARLSSPQDPFHV